MRPPPRFYSQNGEDWYVWNILDRPSSGCVVEVGAFDGIFLSNSHALELIGWRAICVEPHPEYFEQCRRNRPDAHCIQAACVGDSGVRRVDFVADDLGIYSGTEVCHDEIARKHAALGRAVSLRAVQVPATTLDAVLRQCGEPHVDVLSIDTEGNEIDVLAGLDFSRHRPTVVVAEANSRRHAVALGRALADRGYTYLRRLGSVNHVFTCDRDVVRRARRVSLCCELEPLVHPRGQAATALRYRRRRQVRDGWYASLLRVSPLIRRIAS
jgi:FkbM family methyltransferase